MKTVKKTSTRSLSRRSSKQAVISVDERSLTSFPDPPASPKDGGQSTKSLLDGLLDASNEDLFNENEEHDIMDPQSLSAAPESALNAVVEANGAANLVRRLAQALAERDAHVTALRRLAEEYHAPQSEIFDTLSRSSRSTSRRQDLAAAVSETTTSMGNESSKPAYRPKQPRSSVMSLFGGHKRSQDVRLDCTSTTSLIPKKLEAKKVVNAERPNDKQGNREPVEMNTRVETLPPTLINPPDDPRLAEWSNFMHKLVAQREEAGKTAENGELIGAASWGNESDGRAKMTALTRLVLHGIPMDLRKVLWLELSHTLFLMTGGVYPDFLQSELNEGMTKDKQDIMKDIPRTLTDNYDFYTKGKGAERLENVLTAFVVKYEGHGYTQGLNLIAGYLLLAVPGDEDAFWMLCNMVDNFFPTNYFKREKIESSMIGPLADSVVTRRYIQDLAPKLNAHLNQLEIEPQYTVPIGYYLTAFANVLTPKVLFRVWDVLLCLPNGNTFLIQIALAIMSLKMDELMEIEHESEYYGFDWSVPEDDQTIQSLIMKAHSFGKDVTKKEVEHRRRLAAKSLQKTPSIEALRGRKKNANVSTEAVYSND